MGSNYYPWGPHGERVSPLEVKPNPTPSSPPAHYEAPNFAQPMPNRYAAAYPARPAAGTITTADMGEVSRFINFLVSVVVLAIFWQFLVCLYPLPALAAGATAIYAAGILLKLIPPDPVLLVNSFLSILAAYGAAIVVFYFAMRVEERLARNIAYRMVRHVVRLVCLALMAVFAIERASGIPLLAGPDLSVSSANIARILRTPDYLIAVFVFVVMMHFVLWKADKIRAFWHRRLAGAGLTKA